MVKKSPFSFLSPRAKTLFFNGNLPGLEELNKPRNLFWPYRDFVPILGVPERYVKEISATPDGWQVSFKPQYTYGNFEKMLEELTRYNPYFISQTVFHESIVFQNRLALDTFRIIRLGQYLQMINFLYEAGDRGLILEREAQMDVIHRRHDIVFTLKTRKQDFWMRRFIHTILVSRAISDDWRGMEKMLAWDPFPGKIEDFSSFKDRLSHWPELADLSEETIRKAWDILHRMEYVHQFIPFWNWENAPFTATEKRTLIGDIIRSYVERVSSARDDIGWINHYTKQWVESSNFLDDLSIYVRPWNQDGDLEKALYFHPSPAPSTTGKTRPIDVNTIDMGIEYTAGFPLAPVSDSYRRSLGKSDVLGHKRRKRIFKNVARDIVDAFGGGAVEEVQGGHGHDLGYGYVGTDAQGRRWTVEWDGVHRLYSGGKVREDTVGMGDLELITPKFAPDSLAVETVYEVLQRHGISMLGGGPGHINVDLAPFEGRPRSMARFLSLFHEHQNIILLLFQKGNRNKDSLPKIDKKFYSRLQNFRGTEDDLKRLLYNSRYFNRNRGSKTKYFFINMAYYFQDVIPVPLVSQDFDAYNSAGVPWRRQFRVEPNERRMELRFFSTPQDPFESALQIKFVRALLHKALNDETPLSGTVQEIDTLSYAKDPSKAYDDLAKLCTSLDLDCRDYRFVMNEVLELVTDEKIYTKHFTNPESLQLNLVKNGWGRALRRARPREEGISSRGTPWDQNPGVKDCLERVQRVLRVPL